MKKLTRTVGAIFTVMVMLFGLAVSPASAEPMSGGGDARIDATDCQITVRVSGTSGNTTVEAVTYTSNGGTQVDDIVGVNPTLVINLPPGVTSDVSIEAVRNDHIVWKQEVRSSCEVNVYTTPGVHIVNGREWSTTCEPYSQTERCRTEIWATTVTQKDGRFVQSNGWVFNNLTYKASPRSLWVKNPLAAYGKVGGTVAWTDEAGRQWQTECDTSSTGRGGCRTYVVTRVIMFDQTTQTFGWGVAAVFNNMVLFS